MKFLKVVLVIGLAMFVFSCSKGATYDDCVAAAKDSLVKKGTPAEMAGTGAEQVCTACKQDQKNCQPIIDGFKQ